MGRYIISRLVFLWFKYVWPLIVNTNGKMLDGSREVVFFAWPKVIFTVVCFLPVYVTLFFVLGTSLFETLHVQINQRLIPKHTAVLPVQNGEDICWQCSFSDHRRRAPCFVREVWSCVWLWYSEKLWLRAHGWGRGGAKGCLCFAQTRGQRLSHHRRVCHHQGTQRHQDLRGQCSRGCHRRQNQGALPAVWQGCGVRYREELRIRSHAEGKRSSGGHFRA